jgi:hypothetical protein
MLDAHADRADLELRIAYPSARASTGAKIFFNPQWSFVAKVDGEFGDGSRTYAATGTLRRTW